MKGGPERCIGDQGRTKKKEKRDHRKRGIGERKNPRGGGGGVSLKKGGPWTVERGPSRGDGAREKGGINKDLEECKQKRSTKKRGTGMDCRGGKRKAPGRKQKWCEKEKEIPFSERMGNRQQKIEDEGEEKDSVGVQEEEQLKKSL